METSNAPAQTMPPPVRQTFVPGGSPYVYQNTAAWEQIVIVVGGTVTTIEISFDGVTYDPAGLLAGVFIICPGMFLRIVYVLAPAVRVITF